MKKRALVLQSGGSTAVINQSLAGVIDETNKSGKFEKLFGSRFGILGVLKQDFLNLSKISKHEVTRLKDSPSSALGSARHKLSSADIHQIIQNLKRNKIDILFFIGGNDSADTGLQLLHSCANVQIIGIPKTIDNDLPGMDHAPGFGSVARFLAIATQEASCDTRAIRFSDPIKIIETMGRNSGWMVAASSLGKQKPEDGPHLLYFPERPFSENQFVKDVTKVYQKYGWAVIVISETIRDKNGKRIGGIKKSVAKDKFGHPYVEGAAQYLCGLIEAKLKVRARFDKPGTIQRMSLPYISEVDQKEAYLCGVHAVWFALQGKSGVEVAMKRISNRPYKIRYVAIPISEVANTEKKLPDSYINKEGNFVTTRFSKYAFPLIGGNLPSYLMFV